MSDTARTGVKIMNLRASNGTDESGKPRVTFHTIYDMMTAIEDGDTIGPELFTAPRHEDVRFLFQNTCESEYYVDLQEIRPLPSSERHASVHWDKVILPTFRGVISAEIPPEVPLESLKRQRWWDVKLDGMTFPELLIRSNGEQAKHRDVACTWHEETQSWISRVPIVIPAGTKMTLEGELLAEGAQPTIATVTASNCYLTLPLEGHQGTHGIQIAGDYWWKRLPGKAWPMIDSWDLTYMASIDTGGGLSREEMKEALEGLGIFEAIVKDDKTRP